MRKLSGAIVWIVLISLTFLSGGPLPKAEALPKGFLAPANPAFEKIFIQEETPQFQSQGKNFGLIPSPLDWSHLKTLKLKQKITDSFPSSFDLRTIGKTPPVRNQNPYGTCWAFATFGSLESFLLPSESWNFSEDNLINTSGFDPDPYNGGGNFDMATAYLARWSGPVREDQDPYPSPGFVTFPPSKHVQEALILPPRLGPLDNGMIKSALMDYGGIYTAIFWADSYYNPSKASYYFSGTAEPNHAVVIVGWNDDFPASNFSNPPPGNGAFIIRNSWGSSWGEGGYFYVSYYDTNVGRNLAVFNNAEPTDNFTRIYQYDPLGWTASFGYGSETAWFANRFTSQGNETLEAVSFYTSSLNSNFEIYFGQSLSFLQLNTSGSIYLPGYHTISLSSSVPLSSGQTFFVAVRLSTPGFNYPIPLEIPWDGFSSQASALPNQSFVSPDGVNWRDFSSLSGISGLTQGQISNTNVCLKAFTVSDSSPPSSPLLFYSPNSLDFGTDLTQLSFTVRNDGSGTLEWSASKNADWISSINPSSGSLGAGESKTVSVKVSRDGLAPGNYTGSISLASNGGSGEIELKIAVSPPPPQDVVEITNLPATVEVQEHNPLNFTVQATDSLGHSLTFSLVSGPGTINPSTGLFTWSDPNPVGEYQSKIRVTCSGGKWDEEILTIKVKEQEVHTFTLSLSTGWDMISLPLVTSPTPSEVFGGLPSGWRIFSWDPSLPGYRMNQAVTLEVGEGYWLKCPMALEYTIEGDPYQEDLNIPLSVGWHMIGSPYTEEVDFSGVRVIYGGRSYSLNEAGNEGIIGRYLFLWDGSQYQIANALGKFEPGKGYWIRAKMDCVLVFGEGDLPPPPPP